MDVYNIDKSVPFEYPDGATSAQIYCEASIAIFEEVILPLMLQYDNVSLIGEYYDEEKYQKKYVLDVGYEYLALGFLITGNYIGNIVCKKDSINDLTYLYFSNSAYLGIQVGITTNSTPKTAGVNSHKLRIISKNNKLKAFLGCVTEGRYFCFALDTDNFGNKYIYANGVTTIFYDKDDYVNYNYNNTESFRVLCDENYVYKRQLPIYRNSTLYGVSRDIVFILNSSLSGGGLKLVDVEDTKYRQIYENIWYIDN